MTRSASIGEVCGYVVGRFAVFVPFEVEEPGFRPSVFRLFGLVLSWLHPCFLCAVWGEWTAMLEFEWDPEKAKVNLRKHGVSFSEYEKEIRKRQK